MLIHNSSPAASRQRSSASAYGEAFLARMWTEYRAHVEALATWSVEASGWRSLEWSPAGIDMPVLRKVRRQEHRGRPSCFLVNYPGLVAAIPSRSLQRRLSLTGLDGLEDEQVARELSIAAAMRGRGLSDRAVMIVAEFLARCGTVKFWLCRDNAHRIPEMSRAELAALTDVTVSRVARGLLGMLRGARRAGRWGLEYTNDEAALVLGCDESTVRRACRELEASGLTWRLVMWREGVGRRPVDQQANVLLPGPQWMATIDAAITGTDGERDRLEATGAALHCKRRKVEAMRRQYRRRCRRARECGEQVPDPPGSAPVSFGDWWDARALAETEIAAIREEVAALERQAAAVGEDDAAAWGSGDVGPDETLAREGQRDAARVALGREREQVTATTTPERLAAEPERLGPGDGVGLEVVAERAHLRALSSNWVGGLPARSVPSLKAKEKEAPCEGSALPAVRGVTYGRPAPPREARDGGWYDRQRPAPIGAAPHSPRPPGPEPAAPCLASKATRAAQKVAEPGKIIAEDDKSRSWLSSDEMARTLREMNPNFLKGKNR